LIKAYKPFLEYEYRNTTVNLIGQNKTIITRSGADYIGEAEWYNTKNIDLSDNSIVVKNWAKDVGGEWTEEWSNKGLERWA